MFNYKLKRFTIWLYEHEYYSTKLLDTDKMMKSFFFSNPMIFKKILSVSYESLHNSHKIHNYLKTK